MFLVHNIQQGSQALALLSLSVMVNLCYNNKPCVYLLSRCCPISEFIQIINSYDVILAVKMYIILENSTDTRDIHCFLKLSFNEFEGLLW
jgi:hypothetical protein